MFETKSKIDASLVKAETWVDVFQLGGAPATIEASVIQRPVWSAETLERHTSCLRMLSDERDSVAEDTTLARNHLDSRTLKRLRALVAYAYEHIPFYRRLYSAAGFAPGDLQNFKDFERLPIVNKSDMQQLFAETEATRFSPVNFSARTSGSTGQPLTVVNDTDREMNWYVQRILMFEDMMGTKLEPCDWIYSVYYEPFWLTSLLGSYKTFTVGLNADLEHVADHVRRLRPKIISGVANRALSLGKLLPDAKELGIAAITTNSETSTLGERRGLEAELGIPVLDEYSSEELGIIAWETVGGSYTLAERSVYTEIVGNSGNGGEVIGTDLWNFKMPRIRYRQGDYAEWHVKDPEVGCRSVSRIVGREDMALVSQSHGRIDPGRIMEIFDRTLLPIESGVSEFRLVQNAPNNIQLLLKASSKIPVVSNSIDKFRSDFTHIFGADHDFRVEFVEQMPSLGRKRRCIVRLFP
jgi:phenylacetate-CoA ligase